MSQLLDDASAIVAEPPASGEDTERTTFWTRLANADANVIRLSAIVVLLALWEVLGRQINPLLMSYPSRIVVAGAEMVQSGELAKALASSAQSLVIGFVTAAVVGIPLGLLMGRYRVVEYTIDAPMNALYTTPLVAFIPLIMLWFGLGLVAKIVVVFLLTVFPVLINTYVGVRNVSAELIEVGEAFVANEWAIFTKIVLPATIPFIMAGLRLGIGRAIIGMVVAEFFTTITGLGALIVNAANFFQTDRLFVPILLLMVLGIGLTELLQWAERQLAPWKETATL